MRNDALREYRLKSYLNASHYVIFGGEKGEAHPHTWEFSLELLAGRERMIQFTDIEKGAEALLSPYQDKLVNEVPPFDVVIPTLENMLDYFAPEFYGMARGLGALLVKVEASETPTRTCIFSFRGRDEYLNDLGLHTGAALRSIVENIVRESASGERDAFEAYGW